MFLGEDLPLWLLLAFGAALAVGNALALVRPAPPAVERHEAAGDGSDEPLEPQVPVRPPLLRSLLMIAIGSVAAIWAAASLIAG